jgi:hypothetical protein
VFPSRLRNAVERLRARLTNKEPYRCRECGWRGWRYTPLTSQLPDVHPGDLRTGRSAAPVATDDLKPLDPAGPKDPLVSDGELDPLDPKS